MIDNFPSDNTQQDTINMLATGFEVLTKQVQQLQELIAETRIEAIMQEDVPQDPAEMIQNVPEVNLVIHSKPRPLFESLLVINNPFHPNHQIKVIWEIGSNGLIINLS
jgi:hypothetical protein